MIITTNYDQWQDDKGRTHIHAKEPIVCPVCQGELTLRDTKERKVILPGDKDKTCLMIRRMICKNCHTLHSELPDIVVPYKRHGRETVEAIIKEEEPPL